MWSGIPISLRIFQFVVIYTKALVQSMKQKQMFFCNYFFYDPTDVCNLISGSSAFSKSSLNMWKFLIYVLLKPGLENFEHYFTNMSAIVWQFEHFFGIAFFKDLNEN